MIITLACLGCDKKELAMVRNFDELQRNPNGLYFIEGEGRPFTGQVVRHSESGRKLAEANFKEGRFHGLYTRWHSDGWKHMEMRFVEGQADGKWVTLLPDGAEEKIEYWDKGKLVRSEVGEKILEQVAKLEEERKLYNQTIWKEEELAQEHEETFVKLWDDLRLAKDKWQPLEEFQFNAIILGKPKSPEKHEWDIQLTQFTEGGALVSRKKWREKLAELRAQGLILVESEWHQSGFEYGGVDGQSRSTFGFVLHVMREDGLRRWIVRGVLAVDWSDGRPVDGLRQVDRLRLVNATVLEREGTPPFREDIILNPKKDSLTKSIGGTLVDPLIIQDLNGDGYAEILAVGSNMLYFNKVEGRMTPLPLLKHWEEGGTGALLADFTGDSRPDLLLFRESRSPLLYVGSGGLGFDSPPRSIPLSVEPIRAVNGCTAGDVDGDGDLDVWATQYRQPYLRGKFPTPYYDANDGWPSFLLINDGKGHFTDGTKAAGLAVKANRRTYSTSLVDLDKDRDLDLVVVSDFAGLDYYLNDGQGHFHDVTQQLGEHRFSFGMSHVLADFNLDACLDLYMVGMGSTTARRLEAMGGGREDMPKHQAMRMLLGYGNRMLLGDGRGGLAQATYNDTVARTGWAWGCTAVDFDNDGDRDLYIANGNLSRATAKDYCTTFWRHDIYSQADNENQTQARHEFFAQQQKTLQTISWNGFEHNVLYLNEEGRRFTNVAFLLGVSHEFDSRGVVSEDLDLDGRPELIVVEQRWEAGTGDVNQRVHILTNESNQGGHWIGVRLTGAEALGATLVLKRTDGVTEILPVVTGESMLSQHSLTKHFGLGSSTKVESLEVWWPYGKITRVNQPAIDKYHEIRKE